MGTQLDELDRRADLHYAFQHGQDAVRGDFAQVLAEFEAKFGQDEQARAEFERGVADARSRMARVH